MAPVASSSMVKIEEDGVDAVPESKVASTSKLGKEESRGEETEDAQGPMPNGGSRPATVIKKRRFQPTRHLYEPPIAPAVDAKLEEEAAAQNIAQQAGFEGRRVRKFLQRRTVDWNEEFNRWSLARRLQTCARADKVVRPGASHVVELLPAAAYRNSAQAVTTHLVHTSTNKIRCPVNVVRWTPEGRRLLTGSSSGEFTLWNGLTYNFETILQAHDHAIRSILYTKSGTWILSADQGGIIKYFQANMNNLKVLPAHREAVRDLSFSPDDARFVSASDDSTLKIWAFDEAREEKTLKGHGWDVKCVDWHPFKGLLVSGSKDNLVKFWDPRSGGNLTTYHGHKGTVQSVKWSKDGNLVATASRDQVIKLYDIRSMRELHTLKGHPVDVCSLDWHPHHRDLLVSGGSEGSIMFWSLRASDPTVPVHSMPTAHDSNVWTLSWHPLGHVMASGSNDHATRFWERARPEDGRQLEGGSRDEADGKRQERYKAAARGGAGEDWDEDTSFIPGLGNAARRQPQTHSNGAAIATTANGGTGYAGQHTVNGAFNSKSAESDDFALPGMGGAARLGAQQQQQQYQQTPPMGMGMGGGMGAPMGMGQPSGVPGPPPPRPPQQQQQQGYLGMNGSMTAAAGGAPPSMPMAGRGGAFNANASLPPGPPPPPPSAGAGGWSAGAAPPMAAGRGYNTPPQQFQQQYQQQQPFQQQQPQGMPYQQPQQQQQQPYQQSYQQPPQGYQQPQQGYQQQQQQWGRNF